jgi:NitT/TauT family transport system substrate-binding protein
MKLLRRVLAVILLVIVAPRFGIAADAVKLGSPGLGLALSWVLFVGTEKSIFAHHGVELDLISAPSSVAVLQQVASNSIDIGDSSFPDIIRAIDKGAPITILRIEVKSAPYVLFAKSSIKGYSDLKGKTIMIGGPKDITLIYLERMLTPNGVPSGQYDLIYAGSTGARFAALQSGAVDATLLTAPFNFKAEAAGFTKLGVTPEYVKDIPFAGYAVNIQWARTHGKEIQAFLAAYSEAAAWLINSANRDEAIDILVKRTSASRDDAAKSYDFFKEIEAFDVTGSPAEAKDSIGKLAVALKALGEVEGASDVSRFYDPQLFEK